MALAVQLAHVNVQLKNRKRNKHEEMTTAGSANDLWQMTEKSGNDMGSILSNIALRDDHSGYYTSVKGQTLTKAGGYNRQSSGYFMDGHLTPLGEYLERFYNMGASGKGNPESMNSMYIIGFSTIFLYFGAHLCWLMASFFKHNILKKGNDFIFKSVRK